MDPLSPDGNSDKVIVSFTLEMLLEKGDLLELKATGNQLIEEMIR